MRTPGITQAFSVCCLLAGMIVLAGCAHARYDRQMERQSAAIKQLGSEVQQLQRRVRRLEARHDDQVNLPRRSPEQVRAHIQRLKQRRQALLQNLTPAHPDVVTIDRHIAILQKQLAKIQANEPGN